MESKSTGLVEVGLGVKAEVGTIVHEGREFSSGGAFLSDSHAVGYLHGDGEGAYSIRSWDGEYMGGARVVATWKTPRSFVSSHQFQVEAHIEGSLYTGRTAGAGMLWRGKRKTGKPRETSWVDRQLIAAAIGKPRGA